jgi:N-glycosidase YbiA
VIDSFQGEYRFLSNFWPAVVRFDGMTYPTVEHAYQAAKTMDMKERLRISELATPGLAKKAGKKVKMRSDWGDEVKIIFMRLFLTLKFQDPKLRKKLLQTGTEKLVEGNTWGDTFWGVCDGKGKNHLGKLLMEVRKQCRKEEKE